MKYSQETPGNPVGLIECNVELDYAVIVAKRTQTKDDWKYVIEAAEMILQETAAIKKGKKQNPYGFGDVTLILSEDIALRAIKEANQNLARIEAKPIRPDKEIFKKNGNVIEIS